MKNICRFCGKSIDSTLSNCPYCNGINKDVVRAAKDQPLTITDFQKWYADKGLPPYETTRFFIGEDYRQPRAFGIFQEQKSGHFIVYKNLSSGERKVFYDGKDEAYAVSALYQRLVTEIMEQKMLKLKKSEGGSR